MINKKLLYAFTMGMVLVYSSVLGVKWIRSEREFFKKIQQGPFSVVMFYTKDLASDVICKDEKKSWHHAIDRQKENFKIVGDSPLYKTGDVQFLEVDLARKNLTDLAKQYNVLQTPAFALIKWSKALKDQHKKPILLTGFSRVDTIKQFINKHLRSDIEDYIQKQSKRRAAERERREAEAAYLSYNIAYPYYYPYNPWVYGYPYYGAPNIGFGVNIGF